MNAARLWKFLCSLKLAIVLASTAVALMLGGSLLMPGRPSVFAPMDQMTLGEWFARIGAHHPGTTWWVLAAGFLLLLLAVNTVCCFIDWMANLRYRWRKTGEYLLHLGFVLVFAAYLWGALAGSRGEPLQIKPGQTAAVSILPGHYLRMLDVEPVPAGAGRIMDMSAKMVLLRGDVEIARHRIRTNSPLMHEGLAVVPLTFNRGTAGLRAAAPGLGSLDLVPGTTIDLPEGGTLKVHAFYPWAVRNAAGGVVYRGENPIRPALELELSRPGNTPWRGWYFPDEGLPAPLSESGVRLRPVEFISTYQGIFAVNRDPGASLALAGGIAMTAGVFVAMFSFYSKRSRGDRPELD